MSTANRWSVSGGPCAAEADVAHAGVDHLRPARGGAVAQAVAVGAQERAALDDLARDRELRLGGIPAGCLAAAVPVRRPLPDVARHVEQPEPVGLERPDR